MTTNLDFTGEDWTDSEIELVVADYFSMLAMELEGVGYVKLRHNESLRTKIERSKGSIEFKHQNISAVMELLGLPRVIGYKPRRNFQKALIESIEKYLEAHGEPRILLPNLTSDGMRESTVLQFDTPPEMETFGSKDSEQIRRLIRKFDPAARDARNRDLGKRGEHFIFEHEVQSLMSAGRFDLARRVKWVSEELGDGLGYDIHSYDTNGNDRLVEVKTTTGSKTTPFYISDNELYVSEERKEHYKLLRLYEFVQKPKVFELLPPLENSVVLKPANYRASFERISTDAVS